MPLPKIISDPHFSPEGCAALAFDNIINCKTLSLCPPKPGSMQAGQYLLCHLDESKAAGLTGDLLHQKNIEHFDYAGKLFNWDLRAELLTDRQAVHGYINVKIDTKFAETFNDIVQELFIAGAVSQTALEAVSLSSLEADSRIDTILNSIKNFLKPKAEYAGPAWQDLVTFFGQVRGTVSQPLNKGRSYFVAEPAVDDKGMVIEQLTLLPQILGLNEAFWLGKVKPPLMVMMELEGGIAVRKPCSLDAGYDYQWFFRPIGKTKPVNAGPNGMTKAEINARQGRVEFITGALFARSVSRLEVFTTAEWTQP